MMAFPSPQYKFQYKAFTIFWGLVYGQGTCINFSSVNFPEQSDKDLQNIIRISTARGRVGEVPKLKHSALVIIATHVSVRLHTHMP